PLAGAGRERRGGPFERLARQRRRTELVQRARTLFALAGEHDDLVGLVLLRWGDLGGRRVERLRRRAGRRGALGRRRGAVGLGRDRGLRVGRGPAGVLAGRQGPEPVLVGAVLRCGGGRRGRVGRGD